MEAGGHGIAKNPLFAGEDGWFADDDSVEVKRS